MIEIYCLQASSNRSGMTNRQKFMVDRGCFPIILVENFLRKEKKTSELH